MKRKLRLCFAKDGFAYFSTKNPKLVEGSDWNDRPWWCNASAPSGRGIVKVGFDGSYEPWQSEASADEINGGKHPWLTSSRGDCPGIMAGTSIGEFEELIEKAGGHIYVKHSGVNR